MIPVYTAAPGIDCGKGGGGMDGKGLRALAVLYAVNVALIVLAQLLD